MEETLRMPTLEEGHTKECLARALICAVENVRDYEGETDHDFTLAAQDNYFLTIAQEYLTWTGSARICQCEGMRFS